MAQFPVTQLDVSALGMSIEEFDRQVEQASDPDGFFEFRGKRPQYGPLDLDYLAATSPVQLSEALQRRTFFEPPQLSQALRYAAQYSQPRCVEILLKAGATDPRGWALASAIGSPESMRLLLRYSKLFDVNSVFGETPLLHAVVTTGNSAVLDLVIREKVNLNAVGAFGQTALHVCAYSGKLAMAKKLIGAGCDSSLKLTRSWLPFGQLGEMPLDVARRQEAQHRSKPWKDLVTALSVHP